LITTSYLILSTVLAFVLAGAAIPDRLSGQSDAPAWFLLILGAFGVAALLQHFGALA
jgi:hypothetical protein